MMAALARVVHNCQRAADPEHNCNQGNQQGGLHRDLPNAAPEHTGLPNYWGSNEPAVNRRTDLRGPRASSPLQLSLSRTSTVLRCC